MIQNSKNLIREIKTHISKEKLDYLSKVDNFRGAFYILLDWGIIILCLHLSYILGLWSYFISCCVIGNRQRALGNLLHDASHGKLLTNKFLNEWIANIFIAIPLNNLFKFYKKDHLAHHVYLGSEKDPDLIDSKNQSLKDTLIENIFNKKRWKVNLFSNLFKMSPCERFIVLAWWIIILSLIVFAINIKAALLFTGLWYLSQFTIFHVITIIRELSDHVGLENIGLNEYTRNNPSDSLLSCIIHPHNNNWHLVHHLIPYVPHYKLSEAHKLLKSIPGYNKLHHCNGYLVGNHSLSKCLISKCNRNSSVNI